MPDEMQKVGHPETNDCSSLSENVKRKINNTFGFIVFTIVCIYYFCVYIICLYSTKCG